MWMAPPPGPGVAPVPTAVPPPPVRNTSRSTASGLGVLAVMALRPIPSLLPPPTAEPPVRMRMARRNPVEQPLSVHLPTIAAAWEQAPAILTTPPPGPGPVSAQAVEPMHLARKTNPRRLLLLCLRLAVLPQPPQPAGEM